MMMGRMMAQIAGRVALILLVGLVVAGGSDALSRSPVASTLMRMVERGRGDGPPPGVIPAGGTAAAGTNPGRRGPANGAFAGGTAPARVGAGNGAPAGGAFPAGSGGEDHPGGGRPADPSRGLPEFGRDLAALAGIVLVAVLLGRLLTLLAATMHRRQRPSAV